MIKVILAATLVVLCQNIFAGTVDGSDMIQLLESQKKTRRLEGRMLKIARPIIKKTPMGYVMDKITMMMICSVDSDNKALIQNAETILQNYTLAGTVNDEYNQMSLYVDTLQEEHCSLIMLRSLSPDNFIMLFKGNFTIEDLREVDRRYVEQIRQRRQSRK